MTWYPITMRLKGRPLRTSPTADGLTFCGPELLAAPGSWAEKRLRESYALLGEHPLATSIAEQMHEENHAPPRGADLDGLVRHSDCGVQRRFS